MEVTTNKELYQALDSFHNKTAFVKATKENPFLKNKYADFNMIVSKTRKDLQENGLRIKQMITNINGKTAICTKLMHVPTGQSIESVSPVAHKDSDPQSQGSGITYMKRYSYIAMLDLLVDKDDDGNLASGLTDIAKTNEKVSKVIAAIEKTTSEDELKKVFINSGKLMSDKRVVVAKDAKKMELDICEL